METSPLAPYIVLIGAGIIVSFIILGILVPLNVFLIQVYTRKTLAELKEIHNTIRSLGWKVQSQQPRPASSAKMIKATYEPVS